MSELDNKIAQCEKDLAAVEKNLKELKAQKKKEIKSKPGDLLNSPYGKRFVCGLKKFQVQGILESLKDKSDSNDTLLAFDKDGGLCRVTVTDTFPHIYSKIGRVFDFTVYND